VRHFLVAELVDEGAPTLGGSAGNRETREDDTMDDFCSAEVHAREHLGVCGAGDHRSLPAVAGHPQLRRLPVKPSVCLLHSLWVATGADVVDDESRDLVRDLAVDTSGDCLYGDGEEVRAAGAPLNHPDAGQEDHIPSDYRVRAEEDDGGSSI